MEFEFEYEQYDVTINVTATEIDGSDYDYSIESIYDNGFGEDVTLEQLPTTVRQEIEKLAESKAAFKACDAAQDWFESYADSLYDSRND